MEADRPKQASARVRQHALTRAAYALACAAVVTSCSTAGSTECPPRVVFGHATVDGVQQDDIYIVTVSVEFEDWQDLDAIRAVQVVVRARDVPLVAFEGPGSVQRQDREGVEYEFQTSDARTYQHRLTYACFDQPTVFDVSVSSDGVPVGLCYQPTYAFTEGRCSGSGAGASQTNRSRDDAGVDR